MTYSRKGRTTGAVLTEGLVRSARLRSHRGESAASIARDFGVGAETIRRLLRYESWGWVTDEGPEAPPEAWLAPNPEIDALAQAAQARMLAAMGVVPQNNAGPQASGASQPGPQEQQSSSSAGPAPTMPSLDEIMRREFLQGDGVASAAAVERKLGEDAAAEDGLLDGLTGGKT